MFNKYCILNTHEINICYLLIDSYKQKTRIQVTLILNTYLNLRVLVYIQSL